MFAMLSDTASIHLRRTSRLEPAMPSVSKMAMSLRPEGRAQGAVLAVQRVEGQLVAQARLRGGDRLHVEVDVVPVRVGRLERARDRAAADRGGLTVAQGTAQRGLEVDAAGQESRRLDVGDVVGSDPLTLGQAAEGGVQRWRGDGAAHRAGR